MCDNHLNADWRSTTTQIKNAEVYPTFIRLMDLVLLCFLTSLDPITIHETIFSGEYLSAFVDLCIAPLMHALRDKTRQ